jgi:hypothetical protein
MVHTCYATDVKLMYAVVDRLQNRSSKALAYFTIYLMEQGFGNPTEALLF